MVPILIMTVNTLLMLLTNRAPVGEWHHYLIARAARVFNSEQEDCFHICLNLAEHVDHSVVAIVRLENRLDLVHMHRFRKGTSIASVIGYARIFL